MPRWTLTYKTDDIHSVGVVGKVTTILRLCESQGWEFVSLVAR